MQPSYRGGKWNRHVAVGQLHSPVPPYIAGHLRTDDQPFSLLRHRSHNAARKEALRQLNGPVIRDELRHPSHLALYLETTSHSFIPMTVPETPSLRLGDHVCHTNKRQARPRPDYIEPSLLSPPLFPFPSLPFRPRNYPSSR